MTGKVVRATVVLAVLLTTACDRDPGAPGDELGRGVIYHNGVIVTMDAAA